MICLLTLKALISSNFLDLFYARLLAGEDLKLILTSTNRKNLIFFWLRCLVHFLRLNLANNLGLALITDSWTFLSLNLIIFCCFIKLVVFR